MAERNLMQDYADAAEGALSTFLESARDLKARTVTQPLGGKRMSKDERRASYFALSRDPMRFNPDYDFQQQRFKLAPDGEKPIPRRLWDSVKAGRREFEEEGEDG